MNTETTERMRGYVFYDAACGFCTGWVARMSGPLLKRGYHFVPLQSPRAIYALGLKPGEPLTELKLATSPGKVFGGADAVVEIARSIWWAWPMVMLAALPGGRAFMRAIYQRVAENRHCLGSACAIRQSRRSEVSAITRGFYDMP